MSSGTDADTLTWDIMTIVEKYSGIPARFDSNLAVDLQLTTTARRQVIEECFLYFLPEYEWSMLDMTKATWSHTVEDLVLFFEDMCEGTPLPVTPKKDFHFNFSK